ncbi:MAG TPA: glycosyltransferase [Patescibacteria group bacterium]|nr:glycosyltransferase [Patescibacteria group bacterium]
MNKQFPTISIVTATFNSGKTLEKCLKAVRSQDYPQKNIEIILGDGGSTDGTLDIAKKYKARIINIPPSIQNAEYNRGVAYNSAKNELALILDHDNFMPTKDWLKQMTKPFIENPKIVATNTCYYHYDKKFDLMDRYFALFGTSEPLPYFLHKADRMPQTSTKWTLAGRAIDKGDYYLVTLPKDPRKFLSIGTNGCLMRRTIVNKYANTKATEHYPIDIMFEVTKSGHDQFGFVKNSLIHLTHSGGFIKFVKRRKKFVEEYYFKDNKKRRWSVVMPGDTKYVFLFVLYSLTLVGPIFEAIKGFIKIQDIAWFVYPLMCIGTTFIYGYVTLKYKMLELIKK